MQPMQVVELSVMVLLSQHQMEELLVIRTYGMLLLEINLLKQQTVYVQAPIRLLLPTPMDVPLKIQQ